MLCPACSRLHERGLPSRVPSQSGQAGGLGAQSGKPMTTAKEWSVLLACRNQAASQSLEVASLFVLPCQVLRPQFPHLHKSSRRSLWQEEREITHEGAGKPGCFQAPGFLPLRPMVSRDIFSQRTDWEQRQLRPCLFAGRKPVSDLKQWSAMRTSRWKVPGTIETVALMAWSQCLWLSGQASECAVSGVGKNLAIGLRKQWTRLQK